MIRFFNSKYITRPFFLVLLFLAVRVPLLALGVPVTLPELKFMVLGERLQDGIDMYRDVFDNTGPLAALLFWLIDLLDGRSLLLYRVLPALLLLFQAFNFNAILNNHQVLPQKSYIPALLYLLGGSFFFEFDTLSPLLLGHTFVIFSIRYLITVSKEGSNNPSLFQAGFFIGLAALSYLPLALFLLVAYFAVVFFASNTFRSFLLLLCGFFFPAALAGTYYLYNGALENALHFYVADAGLFSFHFLVPPLHLLKLLAVPLAFILYGVLNAASTGQGVVYQQKMQQLLFIWFLVSGLMFFACPEISVKNFILLLPPLAYYGTFVFRPNRRWWVPETTFLLLLGLLLAVRYAEPLGLKAVLNLDASALQLKTDPKYKRIVNGQLLVLGPDLQYYAYNYVASPYLNWELAQEHFGALDSYEAVYQLHENLAKAPPAFIIDEVGLMPKLVYHLPTVFGRYEAAEAENLYRLRR